MMLLSKEGETQLGQGIRITAGQTSQSESREAKGSKSAGSKQALGKENVLLFPFCQVTKNDQECSPASGRTCLDGPLSRMR